MKRSVLAGGGVIAVILAIALMVRGCASALPDGHPVAHPEQRDAEWHATLPAAPAGCTLRRCPATAPPTPASAA